MNTAKKEVRSLLQKLPNDCTIEDIQYHLYVIEKIIKNIASGDLTQNFHLRKHDELKDITHELMAMEDGLRQFVEDDHKITKSIGKRLDQISKSLDHGASPQDLKNEIEEVRKELLEISSHFKI